jgi:uncharacterized protein YbbC (DUF1343 family)
MRLRGWLLLILLTNKGICAEFRLGLENIPTSLCIRLGFADQKTCRFGLITNQTGKNQLGMRNVDLLRQKGFTIARIFAPEHGFDGKIRASMPVSDSIDKKTGIPITSLYGNGTGKTIDVSKIQDIDVLLFDIQDSGMRHYTYISTLFYALKAAAEYNKKIVILDRPNPLGAVMEGPLVEPKLQSFVSIASIPLRHGMTIGELAQYFNKYILEKPASLTVIPMHDYQRTTTQKCVVQSPLSPNIRFLQACYGYSFLGLLGEIEPFDIGVDTPVAFQCLGLPKDRVAGSLWFALQTLLRSKGVHSSLYMYERPLKKQSYVGLRLYVADINKMSSMEVLLTIIDFFKKNKISFNPSPLFNKAAGTRKLKSYLKGKASYTTIKQLVNEQLVHFFEAARESFLYEPLPRLVLLP